MPATACELLAALAALTTVGCHSCEAPEDSCMQQADESTFIESMRTVMLQQRLHLSPLVAAEENHLLHPEVDSLAPVAWLHVPKSGSSFVNALTHLPHVCKLPFNITINSYERQNHTSPLSTMYALLCSQCPEGFLAPGCHSDTEKRILPGDHSGIGNLYNEHVKGHGMVMLRQPEQRIISAWNDNYHSWPSKIIGRDPVDLKEFATAVAGCAVKMITRSGICYGHGIWGSPCGSSNVTSAEAELAVQRLREGFVFVGILEEWDLSMCLFHKMFGGHCNAYDFDTVTLAVKDPLQDSLLIPKSTEDPSLFNTTELGGFEDIYDGRLYEEARWIFKHNLERYNVSRASCQACFINGGL